MKRAMRYRQKAVFVKVSDADDESYLPKDAEKLARQRLPEIVKKAKALVEGYDKLLGEYEHYNRHTDETGEPFQWEFNIKVINIDIPERILDKLSDEELSAAFWDEASRRLDKLIKELKSQFQWIKEIYVVGRSGGWLAIPDREFYDTVYSAIEWNAWRLSIAGVKILLDVENLNVETIIDALKAYGATKDAYIVSPEDVYADKEWLSQYLDDLERELDTLLDVLKERQKDLPKIEGMVSETVQALETDLSSESWWKQTYAV